MTSYDFIDAINEIAKDNFQTASERIYARIGDLLINNRVDDVNAILMCQKLHECFCADFLLSVYIATACVNHLLPARESFRNIVMQKLEDDYGPEEADDIMFYLP